MEFKQKKFDTRVVINLGESSITYKIQDKQSSNSLSISYENITNDLNYFVEQNKYWFNLGILWILIGTFQLVLMVRNDTKVFPLWFVLGVLCMGWYYYRQIKYTTIQAPEGLLLVIKDKQHDDIIKKIFSARNEYLIKKYNVFIPEKDIEMGNQFLIEREIGKFKWLRELDVITEDRLQETLDYYNSIQAKFSTSEENDIGFIA